MFKLSQIILYYGYKDDTFLLPLYLMNSYKGKQFLISIGKEIIKEYFFFDFITFNIEKALWTNYIGLSLFSINLLSKYFLDLLEEFS